MYFLSNIFMALSIKYILLNRYLYHNEAIKIENLLNPFEPILALILAMCVINNVQDLYK